MQISSSVIPLIEYMHIYHLRFLSAVRLSLYIKHRERVCGRAWNVILGGSVRLRKTIRLYVFVSEEADRPVSLIRRIKLPLTMKEKNTFTQN